MYNPEYEKQLSVPEIAHGRFQEVQEARRIIRMAAEVMGAIEQPVENTAPIVRPEISESPLTQQHAAEIVDLQTARDKRAAAVALADVYSHYPINNVRTGTEG
jgi:hypothetical protein